MTNAETFGHEKTVEFASVYRRMCMRERKRKRRGFRIGAKPWLHISEAALHCHLLGIRPERYIGIVIWCRARKLGRRCVPSPRVLASEEALHAVKGFLERCPPAKPAYSRSFDLESTAGPSNVRTQVKLPENEK